MKALTKKVFKDITHRKLRTALTIIGIAIGIIGLSAISIASSEFRSGFEYSTNLSAQPDMILYTSPTVPNTVNFLKNQPNVKAAQAQGHVTTSWTFDNSYTTLRIIGLLDFQHNQINKFQLVEGNLPGPGQILLEYSDKALNAVNVGDQIQMKVLGVDKKITVSGFARTQGLPSASLIQRAQGYMNQSDLESMFKIAGVTDFAIQLDNYNQLHQTASQLTQVLAAHKVQVEAGDIGRDTGVSSTADGLFATMNVLSIIAILLSVCLLLGTVSALIAEQVRYIGTMKAIGGQQGQIMRHYLTLVAIYGAIGTAIGLAIGVVCGSLLAHYLGNLVTMDIGSLTITPLLIVESIVIGIGTPLLAAAFPVFFGTRITVKQALSGHGLDNGGQATGWTRFTGRIFGIFPQTIQYGIRGLFRKRTRTILTLLTLTISGAAFLAVQTTSYAFDSFLDQIFTTYHYDVQVYTENPMQYTQFQQVLTKVNGVGKIEPIDQDTVTTKWGNATLTGFSIDTQLYQKQMVSGRWFNTSDTNAVIISKDAADKSGLKVGDTITFHNSINDASWHIIGIARDYNGIGAGNLGVLIAPYTQIDTFFHLPTSYAEGVMIQSSKSNPTQDDVNALATRVNDALSAAGLLPSVTTAQQQIDQNHSKYQIVYILLDAVALIVALVGAIGLSNALAMSVLERRREIGILRSMGARSWKVSQVFWSEGLSLGVLSWLLAVIVGLPGAYAFVLLLAHLLAPIPFAFNPINLLWMLVLILVIASLASIGPVIGATRVKIAQTLRYE